MHTSKQNTSTHKIKRILPPKEGKVCSCLGWCSGNGSSVLYKLNLLISLIKIWTWKNKRHFLCRILLFHIPSSELNYLSWSFEKVRRWFQHLSWHRIMMPVVPTKKSADGVAHGWQTRHISYVTLKVAARSEGPWKQTSFSGLTCKACLDLSILRGRWLCMEQALQAAETSFWLSNLFIMIIKSLVFNCVNCEPHELTCHWTHSDFYRLRINIQI